MQNMLCFFDAQYVINGVEAEDITHYLLGRNGGLWQTVYDGLVELRSQCITDINFMKVKSHVTCQKNRTGTA